MRQDDTVLPFARGTFASRTFFPEEDMNVGSKIAGQDGRLAVGMQVMWHDAPTSEVVDQNERPFSDYTRDMDNIPSTHRQAWDDPVEVEQRSDPRKWAGWTTFTHLGNRLRTFGDTLMEKTQVKSLRTRRSQAKSLRKGYEAAETGAGVLQNYESSHNPDDLTAGIVLLRASLDYLPPGHSLRLAVVNDLATSLAVCCERGGPITALSESIELHREVLRFRGMDDPHRITTLNNLSTSLLRYYRLTGSVDALPEAILFSREALDLCPLDDSNRPILLVNLANTLLTQFEYNGASGLLIESIELYEEALMLAPPQHASRAVILNNLASSLIRRFEQTGDPQVLLDAIDYSRRTLESFSPTHPDRANSLNNLATSLMRRCKQADDMDALAESIRLYREALALHPSPHPSRAMSLNNLAGALMVHFKMKGGMSTLAEMIQLYREALDSITSEHPDRATYSHNLATALFYRYNEAEDLSLLEEAIALQRDVLALRPDGHPNRAGTLTGLANSLTNLFEATSDRAALDEAIMLHLDALSLRPADHPDRAVSLHNASRALLTRFEYAREASDIADSIKLSREALELRPRGHPDRQDTLQILSDGYFWSYVQNNEKGQLTACLNLRQEALRERADGHPERYRDYSAISDAQLMGPSPVDLESALNHLLLSTSYVFTSPRVRLRRVVKTLMLVEEIAIKDEHEYLKSPKALEVYLSVIELLPRAAHAGLDLSMRLRELSRYEQVCRTASLRAVLLDRPHTAVEVFEAGKAVFWQQALRLRSSALDILPQRDRSRLLDMFSRLESASHGFSESKSKPEMEHLIEKQRALGEEAEGYIQEIRSRPGLDRFLKIPNFDELLQATESGPAVILVESRPHCVAIMVSLRWPERVRTVQLPNLTPEKLGGLCEKVADKHLRGGSMDGIETDANVLRRGGLQISRSSFKAPLAELWKAIVEPVVRTLGVSKAEGRKRPRLYWYPSGKFASLPLHAAGIYDGPGRICVSDFVVSSYIPSLAALIKARKGAKALMKEQVRAFVAGESHSPEFPALDQVEEEVKVVSTRVAAASGHVVNDVNTILTEESILNTLPEAHFLHLACHGIQHADALQSHFALRDSKLTISSLMKLNLPNAVLAFLSACETAKGDSKQPDQAVHLAASMLFSGFRSVIATMWAMNDEDGPQMAEWFYECLFQNKTIDVDDIPYALDDAVQRLRQAGAPAQRWATFIHVGA